jgi:hypothetical protein
LLKRWKQQPSQELLERGRRVMSLISSNSNAEGAIFTDQGVPLARFETHPKRSAHSLLNLGNKPAFVVYDPSNCEVLRIQRVRRMPPTFQMIGDGQVLARIRLLSLLRNSFAIEPVDGARWVFRMPLFTVTFHGASSEGEEVWVQVGPGKTQWNVLLEPHRDSIPFLSALSFIHREWWCYS